MDLELAKFAFQVANALGTLAIGVWLYLERRNDKTNDRVQAAEVAIGKLDDDVSELLIKHGERLVTLESGVEHGPTHRDLGLLHKKINDVDGKVSTIGGQLTGIESNLRQIMGRIMAKGLP